METIKASNSANGTDNHTTFTPNINGNIKMDTTANTKDLKKDKIAEILPFENAVNNDELNKYISV